ncbi:MAG: bifunctional oligoribonuclease/PAP phosphatase NrnA [Actinomycetes bacterium]
MSWSAAPVESDWIDTVSALTSGESVLLVGHVAPDADALGSALAVGLALERLGIPVAVSFGNDPFEVPRILRSLPGQHLLKAPDSVGDPLVVVSFDVSSIDRLGVLRARAEQASTFVAIDHHTSYTGFGTISLVDVTAPATAVLALELVDRLDVTLDVEIATCVYSGIITDTGSFKYAATTPATHELAARLLRTGMRHDLISRHVYDDEPFGVVRLVGAAVSRAELDPDAVGGLGLISTVISAADRAEFNLPIDAAERIIDVVRIATEAEVACVLKEEDDSAWRVSLRSKGQVDVSIVASGLGGGGHRFAAGFTRAGSPASLLVEVRAALADLPHLPE